MAARGSVPALAGQLPERSCGIPVYQHLNVVEGGIALPVRINTTGFVGSVGGGVPSPLCQVDATGKRNAVVNDDELLVVRRAKRMVGIQTEPKPAMGAPTQVEDGKELPLQCIDHGEIPDQHVDSQRAVAVDQSVEKISQAWR